MGRIPLLPAHSVRDAARAVRRVVGQVIHTVTDAILSQFDQRQVFFPFDDN